MDLSKEANTRNDDHEREEIENEWEEDWESETENCGDNESLQQSSVISEAQCQDIISAFSDYPRLKRSFQLKHNIYIIICKCKLKASF